MNHMQGIDRVLFSKTPENGTVIVQGDTGVLKTTFVTECIKLSLMENTKDICLYIALKEDIAFFEEREDVRELIKQNRLIIMNYEEILDSMPASLKDRNVFEAIVKVATDLRKKHNDKFRFLAIDPVNVLETTVRADNIRRVLFHFFSQLNELKTKNWVVMESCPRMTMSGPVLPYHFLADGIITLGMLETMDDVMRYMEIIKMRGVNHSLKKFQVAYEQNCLKILGAIHQS